MQALARVIGSRAHHSPSGCAFIDGSVRLSWADYDLRSDALALQLRDQGLERGERVGVLLPDGIDVHIAYVACEKAGLIVVGIGPRAGFDEIERLLTHTRASALISGAEHRGEDWRRRFAQLKGAGTPLRVHLIVEAPGAGFEPAVRTSGAGGSSLDPDAGLGIDDTFLLNSTSGTTGMPKCVIHAQRRWLHFHEFAVQGGRLRSTDVFLSAIPTPFGFGLWTSHFTPTLLGAPTVLVSRFCPERLIQQIERHRASVLAAVSTQFVLMLDSPAFAAADLSSLRLLYTGGEAVPYERAAEFEERTGARVLQFYGSNETGALSRTTLDDSRQARLGSAGRTIESMRVRLFDEAGRDVSSSGRGQPGCRGPLTSGGYYEDDAANAELYTDDGWMLTGDIATIDGDGYLRVIGRVADFIIRGGKNISGPAVEEAVATHPAVSLAAAVAMPDPVFGERVCVYAELHRGRQLDLDGLVAHLSAQQISIETWPERLIVVDALPRSSGGKVAKHLLREDIRRRISAGG